MAGSGVVRRSARWVAMGVGFVVLAFELIPIIGVGLERVQDDLSFRNRAFGATSLALAAAGVALLVWAARRGWLPKALVIVIVGLVGVYVQAIASGVV